MKKSVFWILFVVLMMLLLYYAPGTAQSHEKTYLTDERIGTAECNQPEYEKGYVGAGKFESIYRGKILTYHHCIKKEWFNKEDKKSYVIDSYFSSGECPEGNDDHRKGYFFDADNRIVSLCVYWNNEASEESLVEDVSISSSCEAGFEREESFNTGKAAIMHCVLGGSETLIKDRKEDARSAVTSSGDPVRERCEDYKDSFYNYGGCRADPRCEIEEIEPKKSGTKKPGCSRSGGSDAGSPKEDKSAPSGKALEEREACEKLGWCCVPKSEEEDTEGSEIKEKNGNGILDGGEECDEGEKNGKDWWCTEKGKAELPEHCKQEDNNPPGIIFYPECLEYKNRFGTNKNSGSGCSYIEDSKLKKKSDGEDCKIWLDGGRYPKDWDHKHNSAWGICKEGVCTHNEAILNSIGKSCSCSCGGKIIGWDKYCENEEEMCAKKTDEISKLKGNICELTNRLICNNPDEVGTKNPVEAKQKCEMSERYFYSEFSIFSGTKCFCVNKD